MNPIMKNILLVDDDHATNLFNKRLIEKAGVAKEVTIAMSGIEALVLLRTKFMGAGYEPELILLDASMPGMNGWQLADEFKRLSDSKSWRTKLVMLTGSLEEIERMKTHPVPHISAYKIKPLTETMLLEIVDAWMKENVDRVH